MAIKLNIKHSSFNLGIQMQEINMQQMEVSILKKDLSTTATLMTEESDHCKEVAIMGR